MSNPTKKSNAVKKITTSAAGGIYYHVHQGFVDTIIVPAGPAIFTLTSSAYRRPSPEGYADCVFQQVGRGPYKIGLLTGKWPGSFSSGQR